MPRGLTADQSIHQVRWQWSSYMCHTQKEPSKIYLFWHLIGFHPLAHHPSSHNPRSSRPSFSHNDLITPSQQWVPLHNTAKSRLLHTFTTFVWDLLPPLSETASPYFWQITKNQTPQRFPSTTLCEAFCACSVASRDESFAEKPHEKKEKPMQLRAAKKCLAISYLKLSKVGYLKLVVCWNSTCCSAEAEARMDGTAICSTARGTKTAKGAVLGRWKACGWHDFDGFWPKTKWRRL